MKMIMLMITITNLSVKKQTNKRGRNKGSLR